MKLRPTLYALCTVALVSVISVSCTKERLEEQYVKLEQAVCSFYGSDNEPLEIGIISNTAAWEVESNAAWLEAVKSEDGDTIILTAADNETESERNATVTVTAGEAIQKITVTQLGMTYDMPRYRKLTDIQKMGVVSPSGKYIGGFAATATGDTYIFHPIIIDTYTNEEYRCGDIPQSQFDLGQAMAISDDGLLFINDGFNGVDVVFDRDGNYFTVEAPGYIVPQVQGTGANGTYWVGFGMVGPAEARQYRPLLWIDRQVQELKMPDKNFRGEDFVTGIMARGISANGEVIYGTTWDNNDFGMVYWKDFNDKAQYVGKDVHEITPVTMVMPDGVTEYDTHIANGMVCTAELLQISPSGKWIAGSYRIEEVSENRQAINYTRYAAFYNTETEKTIIVDSYGESTGMRATEDGIAFIGLGSMAITNSVVYDLNSGTDLGSAQDWVYENYGINIPGGVINFINEKEDVIFGTYAATGAMGVEFKSFYIAPPVTE